MSFNEQRLLDRVAYGSEFGREFNTQITRLRSGAERRNANWSAFLGRYSVIYSVLKTNEDHALVVQAHLASLGMLIPFRFKDWSDFEAENEVIGLGDGSGDQDVQLIKTYSFGSFDYSRNITKPVSGTVQIFLDGVPTSATVNYSTGMVNVDADPGAVISWSGQFDVPVRFDSDRLDVTPIAQRERGFMLSADVTLTEVRL